MDFELTRAENDEILLSKIESIKSAKNIEILIPFAKAYLGLFYVIDSGLAAKEKVRLLANDKLSEAVFSGFLAGIRLEDLPSIESIGHAMAEKKEFPQGYVILAGLDLVAKKSLADIENVDSGMIEKAVGFHFSNKTGYPDIWFDYLLTEHHEKIIPAISKYWLALLNNNSTYLPGRNLLLGDKPDIRVIQYCILPLLDNWIHCKTKILSQLLQLAFKYSDVNNFLVICEHVLENDEALNEKSRLYWIVTAYLLLPDKYLSRLSSYVGRTKSKIMPLLDFIVSIMNDENKINIKFSSKMIIQLIRVIAPIFPPQHHVYGALGELDINSGNVMSLFYKLLDSNDKDVVNEIKLLRKARVMRIYAGVIDNLLELHLRKNNENNFTFPDFDHYIETLVKSNCLQSRSNKFDLR